jgi:hypothetical protein
MIRIAVDEAYAFDFLSILEVKKRNVASGSKNYEDCKALLIEQLGQQIVDDICDSEYYSKLVEVNQLVFAQIELIRNGEFLNAKEVDDANMLRFKYKQELQRAFFNIELTEQKTKEV